MQLKRTVPFLSKSLFSDDKVCLLVDKLEILDTNIVNSKLFSKLL